MPLLMDQIFLLGLVTKQAHKYYIHAYYNKFVLSYVYINQAALHR